MIYLNLIINNYILPLGFFLFLAGILFLSSISAYHTQIYLFLIIPTFILLFTDRNQFRPILYSRSFQILLLLFVYAALSLLWNDPTINDFKYIKRLLIITLFVLAVISIGKKKSDKIIAILLLAAGAYAIAAYYGFYSDYIVGNSKISARIVGIGNLSNPLLSSHIYGIFTSLLMAYFFAIKRNLKFDIILVLMFIGLLGFVILTNTRTPLLGIGTVLLLLLWMHRSKYVLYFFFLIIMFSAIYFTINFDLLMHRGLSYRPEIWSIDIKKIMLKPLLGHGLGTDIYIESDNLPMAFSDAHNGYLGLTYNLGILGLLLWIIFLITLFSSYIRNKASLVAQIGIVLLVYGMAAVMADGASYFSRPKEVWFLIWLPIALIFSAEYECLRVKYQEEMK